MPICPVNPLNKFYFFVRKGLFWIHMCKRYEKQKTSYPAKRGDSS